MFKALIFTLSIFVNTAFAGQNVICVGSDTQSNDSCGVQQQNLYFLSSLDPKLKANISILLMDSQIPVEKTIKVFALKGFHITGTHSAMGHSTIACSGGNSGLSFTGLLDLTISGITFSKCAGIFDSTSSSLNGTYTIRAAVYMINCTNIKVLDTVVDQSSGNGMVLFDCTGNVEIAGSNFTNNQVSDHAGPSLEAAGGGGLYIEFSKCSPKWIESCHEMNYSFNSNANYHIDRCNFINNERLYVRPATSIKQWDHYGNTRGGGGIALWTSGYSSNNTILITDTWFIGNKARYGGGLYFHFKYGSRNHALIIVNTTFERNVALNAGGAVDTGTISFRPPFPDNITVSFDGVRFVENQAKYGGGTSVFSSRIPHTVNSSIKLEFKNSLWLGNTAQFAFGMNLRSVFGNNINSFTPMVTLSECIFKNNKVSPRERSNSGLAALHARVFPITLTGSVQFISNEGSGIRLVDSSVILLTNTTLLFMDNTANFGGGISLIGFSSMTVHSSVQMNFTNNCANFKGGAIYSFSIDGQPEGICFIEHDRASLAAYNADYHPTLYFNGNKAANISNSIYISSIVPCLSVCQPNFHMYIQNRSDVFQVCLGNFDFADSVDGIDSHIRTAGSELDFGSYNNQPSFKYVPGKFTLLPFSVYDELDTKTNESFFLLSVANGNDQISLGYRYTANKMIQLMGQPGQNGTIDIDTSGFQNLTKRLNVILTECPPGFVIENRRCICSTLSDGDKKHYKGISRCNTSNDEMFAYASFGFWVGYWLENDASEGEDNLYTATCPQGYCSYSGIKHTLGIKLPSEASRKLLDQAICGSRKRTGILCGECAGNHSAYFHSWDFVCGRNDLCEYGIVFYFLSEIIPVTLMFSIIVIMGFNFNSGKFNGLILFAQLSQSLAIMANGAIIYRRSETILHDISAAIYGPFNLNFFKINSLSFCIFKGANFFTIILMEFFTLAYALVLIVSLVYLIRTRCCYRLQIACFRRGITKTASLTKGLAAFLIICYSKTTQLSYEILNVGRLNGKGGETVQPLRVFRMGSIQYFTGYHIPFSIGAVFLVVTIVAIPPFLLIVYPQIYKLLPENFQKRKRVKVILKVLEKYRPLFDTFQGCFQDKHRYFAGIHFLYRSVFVTTHAFINSRLTFYMTNQLVAIMMLFLHLWMQPYKQLIHNLLDGLVFTLLALINLLTTWRYVLSMYHYQSRELFTAGIAQFILLLSPAVVTMMYYIYKVIRKFCFTKNLKQYESGHDDDSSFFEEMEQRYRGYSESKL